MGEKLGGGHINEKGEFVRGQDAPEVESAAGKVKGGPKEGWEVVKDLADLSDVNLASKIGSMSAAELDELESAVREAEGGVGEGESGVFYAHANAERAGMPYEDFLNASDRIYKEIQKRRSK